MESSLALPFTEPEFVETYRNLVAPVRGENFVTVETAVGHAHVVVRSRAGLRVAELAGRGVADYADLVYEDHAGGTEVVDALVQHDAWDAVVLRNVPDRSPTIALATARAQAQGWHAWPMPGQVAPFVEITEPWGAYADARGDKKARYNRRRAARKLEADGAHVAHATDPADVRAALLDAFELYGVRERGVSSSWRFNGVHGRRFFTAYSERLAARGQLDVAVLRTDVPLAFAYCIHHGGVVYYCYVGITDDPKFARWSPGTVLLEHLLEQAFEQRRTRFDFMLGDEPYKHTWATGVARVESLLLAPRTRRGRAAFEALRASTRAREFARNSPRVRAAVERLSRMRTRKDAPA